MTFQLEFHEHPTTEDLAILGQGLTAHAAETMSRPGFHKFAFFHRDQTGTILGGISGQINWNWAFVHNFWVEDSLRHKGLGTELVLKLEEHVRTQGCKQIHLDTFSFQAPQFYENLGYTLFAELDDYPEGHTRMFYRKAL